MFKATICSFSFSHLGLVSGEEANVAGVFEHAVAILVRRRVNDLEVGVDKGRLELARRAKVQQTNLIRGRVEEKVGPVGVSLHVAMQEQLSEKQESASWTIIWKLGSACL